MLTLHDLTQANITSLNTEQLDQLHRGAHRVTHVSNEHTILAKSHDLLASEQTRRGIMHTTPIDIPEPQVLAIYLKAPHGTLIFEGKKRAIAKPHPIRGIEGKRVVVSKENGVGLAFGTAIIGDPEQVTAEEFDKRFDEHRVTAKERLRWWEGIDTLSLYPILHFAPYDTPHTVDVPSCTQTLMTEVKFTDAAPDTPNLLQLSEVSTIDTIEEKEEEKEEEIMPWKPSDATRFTKLADTPKKQRQWAEVANSSLKRCLDKGGETKTCEASAIRQANSVLKGGKMSEVEEKIKEAEAIIDEVLDTPIASDPLEPIAEIKAAEPGQITCTCPNCKEVVEHESGTPCREIECPKCGSMLRGGGDEEEKSQPEPVLSADVIQAIADIVHKKMQSEPVEVEVATKAEPETPKVQESVEEPVEEPVEAKAGRRVRKDKLSKLKELFQQLKDLIGWAGYEDEEEEKPTLPVAKAFKGRDGRTWLMLWTTNSYLDRDKEIFRIKAIQDYVDRYSNNPIKGEFQFWHIPGTKFGDIVWQAVVADRFLVQMGTFDDTPTGNAFKNFLTTHPESHPGIAPTGWGASHGYNYVDADRADGVYDWFNTVESSVLPMVYAANLHNPNPLVLGGKEMDEKQTDALRVISDEVGVDLVDIVEKTGQQKKAELDDFVEHKSKDVEVTAASTETPATDTQPTESEPEVEAKAKELQTSEEGPEAAPDVKAIAESVVAEVSNLLQLESLSDTIKTIQEQGAGVANALTELSNRVAQLEQSDEKKVAERMQAMPRLSWFRSSQAKETVLTPDDNLTSAAPARQGPVLPIPRIE